MFHVIFDILSQNIESVNRNDLQILLFSNHIGSNGLPYRVILGCFTWNFSEEYFTDTLV